MITKKFGEDFHSNGGALTLSPSEVGNYNLHVETSHTHKDGWTITATVVEDYYEWINEFKAMHPKYGTVWGNFEHEVYAESEEAFKHFYDNHTPQAWDYGDI